MENSLTQLLDHYLNEKGLWYDFKEYANELGYSMAELGLEDDYEDGEDTIRA